MIINRRPSGQSAWMDGSFFRVWSAGGRSVTDRVFHLFLLQRRRSYDHGTDPFLGIHGSCGWPRNPHSSLFTGLPPAVPVLPQSRYLGEKCRNSGNGRRVAGQSVEIPQLLGRKRRNYRQWRRTAVTD